jgi:hypothetical protein
MDKSHAEKCLEMRRRVISILRCPHLGFDGCSLREMLTQTKEAGKYISATKVIVVTVRVSWIVFFVMVSVAVLSWSAMVSRSWIFCQGLDSFVPWL